jgi:hypothetical protein
MKYLLIIACILSSCGSTEEEKKENVDNSKEVSYFGSKSRVEGGSLLRKSCGSGLYMDFLIDEKNRCTAVSQAIDYDYKGSYDRKHVIKGAAEEIAYYAKLDAAEWYDSEDNKYFCYIYSGAIYKSDGEREYFGGTHMILSTKEAATYDDLADADIHVIGTSKQHCESMY